MRAYPAGSVRLDTARDLMAELDLDAVQSRLLEAARHLTGARYAALGVPDASGRTLARFETAGVDPQLAQELGPLPAGHGVLGEVIRRREALRLADVSTHPRSYGFPAGHPHMRTFLGVPMFIHGRFHGGLYVTEKAGGETFTEADEGALVALAELAAIALDHAERYTRVNRRREELQRSIDALEVTMEITTALAGETELETILALVAKRGRALVSARALLIGRRAGDDLIIAAGAGEMPTGFVGRRMSLENTVASAVISTGRSQHLPTPRVRAFIEESASHPVGAELRDGLMVPLVFRGETYGVLVALDRLAPDPYFSAEDQRLLEAFAASSAMAIGTASSAAEERRRQGIESAEGERRRWARELHDETLQSLASLRISLINAVRDGRKEVLADTLDRATGQLQAEIDNLRELITDLRPAALDELGTGAAVTALVERVRREGVDIDLVIDLAFEQGRAETRHLPDLETAVYRIVQEALTNATRHGSAQRVVVEITEDDSTVSVVIRDDGQGFETATPSTGYGLIGMRERAELLQGKLSLRSMPGQGTVITAVFPVQRRPREADCPAEADSQLA